MKRIFKFKNKNELGCRFVKCNYPNINRSYFSSGNKPAKTHKPNKPTPEELEDIFRKED